MVEKKSQQLSFFGKSKKGLAVALKSFDFIWHHKKLLFFPLLTAVLIGSTIGIYEVAYYKLYHQHIDSFFPKRPKPKKIEALQTEHTEEGSSTALLLFSSVITFAVILFSAFSNIALSYAASEAFKSVPIRLGASLMHSFKKLPTLLLWTLVAFIIHILVKFFKDKDKKGRSSFLRKLIGEAIEFAWYIATFLIIPILAHENIGAFSSIKRSTQLMKKTFGENLAVALLLPELLFILLGLLLFMMFGIFLIIIGEAYPVGPVSVAGVFGCFFVVAGIVCVIASATTTVFKTAAYYYAIGNPVGPFSVEEIQSSFVIEVKK